MPSRSAITCDDSSTVIPVSATSASSARITSWRANGSRSASGSSSSTTVGRLPSTASATRVRCPPESVSIRAPNGTSGSATSRRA